MQPEKGDEVADCQTYGIHQYTKENVLIKITVFQRPLNRFSPPGSGQCFEQGSGISSVFTTKSDHEITFSLGCPPALTRRNIFC